MEGLTQYYEKLWCARAGIISDETLLAAYAEIIEKEDARPGRKVMSLEESSWLAWTKLYQADENFVNSAVSYYSRGAQAGFALDAKIRAHTKGEKSLDDVMKLAMERFGWPKPGFAERGFEKLCEEVAGADLATFWRDYTQGTKDHDYSEALNVYGLELKREKDEKEQWLGATVAIKDALFQVRSVETGSPAARAGLQARDEILALNGHKITSKDFEERLKDFKPGTRARLSLFRRGKLVETEVEVGTKPASKLKLVRVKKPSAQQEKNFKRWLWK